MIWDRITHPDFGVRLICQENVSEIFTKEKREIEAGGKTFYGFGHRKEGVRGRENAH